jgi:chromosome segregation ATPase
MKPMSTAIVLFLATVPLLTDASRAASTSRSPKVEKVVELLKDLQANLEADEKREQQMYDKYACWCETITHKKAEAIIEAKETMRTLGQEILSLKGKVATLTSEIEQLLKDMEENEKAQKTATEIRRKENEAFQAESMELKQALAALEKCIAVLVEATMPMGETALLQQSSKAQLAGQRLKEAIAAAPLAALAAIEPSRLSLLKNYASQLSQGKAGYTPQSLTIQGILKEMYATFSDDLESKMEDEAEKNSLFEDLIATKQKEMIEMQESVKKKTAQKAEAEVMLAEATQAYDDTEAELNHDIEFFDVTKEACGATADEWSDRKALREQEIEGVKKAIEILDTDDARQLFDDAIQEGHQGGEKAASFIQVSSDVGAPARMAFGALKAKAASTKSLRLARVAVKVIQAKAGHFDEVIKAIDKMINDIDITEEQEDEKKIDQCKNEYAKINGTMEDLLWKIGKNEAKIDKLTLLVEEMEKELQKTVDTIKETEDMVVEMNATREQENKDYLAAKQDDNDAIDLLKEAREALEKYYKENEVKSMDTSTAGGEGRRTLLLQKEDPAAEEGPSFDISEEQAPEVKFSGKGHRKGEAKGILAIISDIIEDLEGELALSKKQEEAAQLEHEKQVAAAHELIETLKEKKANLETDIENKKEDKLDEEEDKTKNEKDLKDEEDYLKEIKPDCDWIIDNAPERRAKRRAELEGLTAARAYLVGYQENSGLGKEVAANQAGLLQGAKKGAHSGAEQSASLDELKRREKALKAIAAKEEKALFGHQHPISQAALVAKSGGKAQVRTQEALSSYEQLKRKEAVLQKIFKQEQKNFESRQPHTLKARSASMLQQQSHATQASINKLESREKHLASQLKKVEADFAERQKHYHPMVRGAAMLQQQAHASKASVDKLESKQRSLMTRLKKVEADFAQRQEHYHPLEAKGSLLQEHSHQNGQVHEVSSKLLHRLNRLQVAEKKVANDFFVRQPVHRPSNIPDQAIGQATIDELMQKEKRLRAQAKEEHDAFLQSQARQ